MSKYYNFANKISKELLKEENKNVGTVWIIEAVLERELIGADNEIKIEDKIDDSLARGIEEKFLNAMLGISETPKEYPGFFMTNYLKASYDQAKAMKLNDILTLKHCCTVLNKIINDNQNEKIRQALDSPTNKLIIKEK